MSRYDVITKFSGLKGRVSPSMFSVSMVSSGEWSRKEYALEENIQQHDPNEENTTQNINKYDKQGKIHQTDTLQDNKNNTVVMIKPTIIHG